MEDFIYDSLLATNIFDVMYDTVKNILTFNTTDFNIATNLYKSLLPLGYTLILLYFLLELLEKTTHDQFNLEVFVKMFIKLVFAETIMDYGDELIGGFVSIGNWFITEVKTTTTLSRNNSPLFNEQELRTAVDGLDFWEKIPAVIMTFVIWIITAVTKLTIQVQCSIIKIELILRAALSPIAIADMFSDINRSTGWRYLKKILGVAMQGGAILAVYAIGSEFQTADMAAFVENGEIHFEKFLDIFIITFCLIGITATSKQVINDALGN